MTAQPLPFFVSETDPPAKAAILTAALAQFASRGFDGVSIRDIAAEAGFTNPAMFRHFASKEALGLALFEACYRRLSQALASPAVDAPPTLRDRIAACLEMIEASPDSVHFVLENLRRFWPLMPAGARKTSLVAAMRAAVVADQQAGRVRADIDPQLAATMILGALGQIARMSHFGEWPRPPRALADDLWALIEGGLKA